jgi:hypothetical protein
MKNLLFFLVALLFISSSASSAIWRVNNMPNSSANFTSLIAAVEAAAPNDIIYLEGTGTTYDEGELYLAKPLTIIGNGFFLTENDHLQANHFPSSVKINLYLDAGSEGTILSGLSVIGGNIYVYTSDITIERCYITVEFRLHSGDQSCSNFLLKQCYVTGGLWTWSMFYESSNIVIENNIIFDDLTLISDVGQYIVKNNVLPGNYNDINAVNAVVQNNIANGIIADEEDNNMVENNIIGMGNVPVGGNNNLSGIDFTEVFVDWPGGENSSTDAMYELLSGSAAQGHGVGGIDCGIFDGDFPYILSGLPPIPRIFETDISGVGTSEGLRVQIKASAQQ